MPRLSAGKVFTFKLELNPAPNGFHGGHIHYRFDRQPDPYIVDPHDGTGSVEGEMDLHDGQAAYSISVRITDAMVPGVWKLSEVSLGNSDLKSLAIPDNVVFEIPALTRVVVHIEAPRTVTAGTRLVIRVRLEEFPKSVKPECVVALIGSLHPIATDGQFTPPAYHAAFDELDLSADKRSYEMSAPFAPDLPSGKWRGEIRIGSYLNPDFSRGFQTNNFPCRTPPFEGNTEFSLIVQPASTLITPASASASLKYSPGPDAQEPRSSGSNRIDASPDKDSAANRKPGVKQLPPPSERWALLVGIDKYNDPELNPLFGQNDAKRIEEDLTTYAGFDRDHVIRLSDDQPPDRQPTRERILWWLSSIKQNASPRSLILLAFSGHGMTSDGSSFLIAKDTALNFDSFYLSENAIKVDSITESLKDSLAKQIILFIDACRNNPYAAKGTVDKKMTKQFVDSFDFDRYNSGKEAYATIFATSPGGEAYEYQSEKMGYFTYVLDQGIRGAASDAAGKVTLGSLVDYLQRQTPSLVKIHTPGREQVPYSQIDGYLANDLVLAAVQPAVNHR